MNFPYSSSTCIALPFYLTTQTCPLLPAPAQNTPANPRTGGSAKLQLFDALEDDDDDQELISAVSQFEAQLNTGAACEANANIGRMFCVI